MFHLSTFATGSGGEHWKVPQVILFYTLVILFYTLVRSISTMR
ncbi:MAG: hypothetical protein OEM32_02335 [Acidimicrobiia bacterium]|nr:hypothetical protein [Acidimicrobiia bacterium]